MGYKFRRTVTVPFEGSTFVFRVPDEAARVNYNLDAAMLLPSLDTDRLRAMTEGAEKAAASKEFADKARQFHSLSIDYLKAHFISADVEIEDEPGAEFTAADIGLMGDDIKALAAAFADALRPSSADVPKSSATADS